MINRTERSVILAATIGSVLEWYEFYLFIYLSPIISLHFFSHTSEVSAWLNTLAVFAIGFLSRPLGALIFGHLGDRLGRKPALFVSIIMITAPTIAISFVPGYAEIGLAAPIILCFLRLLQGLPVGAEITGAMCYLYEEANPKRRVFISSWTFFGSQIGALFCTIEIWILQQKLSYAELAGWGWRLSFLIGGLIGLFGLVLRYRLRESPLFVELKESHELSPAPIKESFTSHKLKIGKGILLTASMMAGNFVLFFFFASYFERILLQSFSQSLIISAIMLMVSITSLPFFGKLANRYSKSSLFLCSVIGLIAIAYPLFYSVNYMSFPFFMIIYVLAVLLMTLNFAILPSLLAELFPTRVRYTCLGVSYNLCSSLLGGTAPIACLYLIHKTHMATSPALVMIATGLMTLGVLFFQKKSAINTDS
jgi:MFS transporter, MHS family, proline/betaine transporter